MPIIPRVEPQVRQQSSAPVAIAGTSDARIAGNAIQDAGKGLMEFGAEQLDFARKTTAQEFDTHVDSTVKAAQEYARVNSKSDGSDYEAKYAEKAKPALDEAVNKFAGWDPRLRSEFSSRMTRVNEAVAVDNVIAKNHIQEADNYYRAGNVGSTAVNDINQNMGSKTPGGDENYINAKVTTHLAYIESLPISAQNKQGLKNKFMGEMAEGIVGGLANKQMFGKALQYLQANQEHEGATTDLPPDQAKALGLIDGEQADQMQRDGVMHKIPTLTKGDKFHMTPAIQAVLANLDPGKRASLIDRMRSENEKRVAVRLGDVAAQISGFQSLAKTGGTSDDDLKGILKTISQTPNMSGDAKVRAMDAARSSHIFGQEVQAAANGNPTNIPMIKARLEGKMALGNAVNARDPRSAVAGKDFAVLAHRSEVAQQFDQAVAQIQKKREMDPAGYKISNDPEIAQAWAGTKDGDPKGFASYARTIDQKLKFEGMGVSGIKLLPKQDAQRQADALASITDPNQANDMLNDMSKKYGDYMPRVLNELAEANKDVQDFRVLALVRPDQRSLLFDAVKNSAANADAIKKDEGLKAISETADIKINAQMTNFRGALVGMSDSSAGQSTVNSLQKLVKAKVDRDILRNGGKDLDGTVQRAYNDVVGNNFNVITGGTSTVLVPKMIGNYYVDEKQTQNFKSFMKAYSTPEALNDLGVNIPLANRDGADKVGQKKVFTNQDWAQSQLGPGALADPMTGAERYLSELAKTSRWVTNPTQTGLMLVQPTSNGGSKAVIDKTGRPIERTFEDIYMKPDKRTQAENSFSIKKLFGG